MVSRISKSTKVLRFNGLKVFSGLQVFNRFKVFKHLKDLKVYKGLKVNGLKVLNPILDGVWHRHHILQLFKHYYSKIIHPTHPIIPYIWSHEYPLQLRSISWEKGGQCKSSLTSLVTKIQISDIYCTNKTKSIKISSFSPAISLAQFPVFAAKIYNPSINLANFNWRFHFSRSDYLKKLN